MVLCSLWSQLLEKNLENILLSLIPLTPASYHNWVRKVFCVIQSVYLKTCLCNKFLWTWNMKMEKNVQGVFTSQGTTTALTLHTRQIQHIWCIIPAQLRHCTQSWTASCGQTNSGTPSYEKFPSSVLWILPSTCTEPFSLMSRPKPYFDDMKGVNPYSHFDSG